MKTFAFLTPPSNKEEFKKYWPLARFFSAAHFKKIPVNEICSARNIQTRGFILALPLLPAAIMELSQEAVIEQIISAAESAKKLGAQILGIDGAMGIALDKEQVFPKRLQLPVTTGSTLTAWTIIEAIFRMARVKNIDLKNSSLAIMNTHNAVGSLCARKFADYGCRIITVAHDADIVINPVTCEIALRDGSVIKAGKVKLPFSGQVISAAMAEVMLLALDERLVSYSLGENIILDKLEEIADIAVRHGFEIWVPEAPPI